MINKLFTLFKPLPIKLFTVIFFSPDSKEVIFSITKVPMKSTLPGDNITKLQLFFHPKKIFYSILTHIRPKRLSFPHVLGGIQSSKQDWRDILITQVDCFHC